MDALVVLFVVLSAAIIAVLVYGKSESESLTATVKHRGETVAQVVLDTLQEEKTVTIDGKYHLTVTVTRDGVSVTESDCPGQDCVHTGCITKAGQSIVCLPEQRRFVEQTPGAVLRIFETAKHEIYNSDDAVKSEYVPAVIGFLNGENDAPQTDT